MCTFPHNCCSKQIIHYPTTYLIFRTLPVRQKFMCKNKDTVPQYTTLYYRKSKIAMFWQYKTAINRPLFQKCKNENYIAVAIHLNKSKNLWLRSKFINQHKQVKFPALIYYSLKHYMFQSETDHQVFQYTS